MTPIFPTLEQTAFHEKIKAFVGKVYAGSGALRGKPVIIQQAHLLLDRAIEMKLPQAMLVDLQILISHYENEGRLPAHLRGAWYKGGDTPDGDSTPSVTDSR